MQADAYTSNEVVSLIVVVPPARTYGERDLAEEKNTPKSMSAVTDTFGRALMARALLLRRSAALSATLLKRCARTARIDKPCDYNSNIAFMTRSWFTSHHHNHEKSFFLASMFRRLASVFCSAPESLSHPGGDYCLGHPPTFRHFFLKHLDKLYLIL